MGGLTGVLVRRSRDPQSRRRRPLRVGIRRREVAVDRYVTEVVLGDGEVVAGGARARGQGLFAVPEIAGGGYAEAA
jgi:hypothetical protein